MKEERNTHIGRVGQIRPTVARMYGEKERASNGTGRGGRFAARGWQSITETESQKERRVRRERDGRGEREGEREYQEAEAAA